MVLIIMLLYAVNRRLDIREVREAPLS